MRLAPYVQSTPEGHLAFAVQNASDEPIHLDLERLRPPLMGFALGLFREQDGLRLFVSDDSEFTARPGHPDRIRFFIRAKAVQTFVLVNKVEAAGLYLWNPNARQAFEDRRRTMQVSFSRYCWPWVRAGWVWPVFAVRAGLITRWLWAVACWC